MHHEHERPRWVFTPARSRSLFRSFAHAESSTYVEYKMNVETEENRTQPWCSYGDVNSSSTTTLHRTAVGNMESTRRIDVSIPAGSGVVWLICKSQLDREANRQRCRRRA